MIGSHALAGALAPNRRGKARGWLLMALLAAAIVLVYWPVRHHGFVTYDDPDYVSENRVVQSGLTWSGLRWAFGTGHASNWHPLTWLSHMLDVELFGRGPTAPHLVNLGLHATNAVLVFALLRRLTGAMGSSVAAAALFGLHPLRVESVAWVAERKDVLSGFFFLATLWAYARYAEVAAGVPACQSGSDRVGRHGRLPLPCVAWYLAALLLFAGALLSKPMAVTLPFVLLLLDFWPLRRTRWLRPIDGVTGNTHRDGTETPPRFLLAEKVPFFGLSVAACVITWVAQERGGAVRSVDAFPVAARFGNALVSYARYLEKTFWPTDLAVFYPHPGAWPALSIIAAAAMLIVITAFAWRARRKFPAGLVGWAWFCGMLVPTLGLVQVGGQAMADRYTYLPAVGLSMVAASAAAGLESGARWVRIGTMVSFVGAIMACAVTTRAHLGHWRDGESLFRHALAVTEENYVAHNNLAGWLLDRGEVDEAVAHARAAIVVRPNYADAYNNLGQALLLKGKIELAVETLETAAQLAPDVAEIRTNLGNARLRQGRIDDAIVCYRHALQLRPDDARTHNNLGWAVFQAGRSDEAIAHLTRAVALEPHYGNAHHNLAGVLLHGARVAEAIEHLQHAAAAYAREGDLAGAIAATEKGLQLIDAQTNATLAETLRTQSASYRARSLASQP